jgi:hypothetical protein
MTVNPVLLHGPVPFQRSRTGTWTKAKRSHISIKACRITLKQISKLFKKRYQSPQPANGEWATPQGKPSYQSGSASVQSHPFKKRVEPTPTLKHRSESKPTSTITCHGCGVKGHYESDCPQRQTSFLPPSSIR